MTACIFPFAPSIRLASISAIEALGRGGVGRGFLDFPKLFLVNPRRSREARAGPAVPTTGSTPTGTAAGDARGPPCGSTAAGAARDPCGPPGPPSSTRRPKPNFVTPFAQPSIRGAGGVPHEGEEAKVLVRLGNAGDQIVVQHCRVDRFSEAASAEQCGHAEPRTFRNIHLLKEIPHWHCHFGANDKT